MEELIKLFVNNNFMYYCQKKYIFHSHLYENSNDTRNYTLMEFL